MSITENKKKQKDNFSRDKSSGEKDWFERVVKINRVMKVCKGGKRLGFRVFVVVGNLDGEVGIGLGKAAEVPIAIKKAMEVAKKNLIKVTVLDGTLPHISQGHFGAAKVLLKPAPEGTGVIAGGAVRVLLEAAGIRNAVAKSLGTSNPINCARATLNGLLKMKNVEEETVRRGIPIRIRKPIVAVAV